jgi:hypothetical protein
MIPNQDNFPEVILTKVSLDTILKILSAKERDILVMWWFGGYSKDEIAEIIKVRYQDNPKITGKTIEGRLKTIMFKLKRYAQSPKNDIE